MGGGGTTYEHHIQTVYLTAMMLRLHAPLVLTGTITEIAYQTKRYGFHTDDLLIKFRSELGIDKKFLVQAKYNMALSAGNEKFAKVVKEFWLDFNNADGFNPETDKLLLVKSHLTSTDKNQVGVLLNWAATHKDAKDFYLEVKGIKIKEKYLEMLVEMVTKANDGKKPDRNRIWKFLRSFALAELDLGVENSVDHVHMLNLIGLSKSDECTLSPMEIWNNLLAKSAYYNNTGGSIDFETARTFDEFRYFNTSKIDGTYEALALLEEESTILLAPFRNHIKGFYLNRSAIKNELAKAIQDHRITIITGGAGTGKSALMKELLSATSSKQFVFKADQLDETNISHVLSKLSIRHGIRDVLSSISLLRNTIIVVDSMEKLLESEREGAFSQLLALTAEFKEIKLVFTSRGYAVNLVRQKFGIPLDGISVVEVPYLRDMELDLVSTRFPKLKPYLKHRNFRELMRSPKYIEFALQVIDFEQLNPETISLAVFKSKLWNHIIEDVTTVRSGLARKRGRAFSHIAVERALAMTLFIEPEGEVSEEAIEALVRDDVIYQNKEAYEFSPSHDVLEDWALVRYISKLQKTSNDAEHLFATLGNKPALRRAFRLWVEDFLTNDSEKVTKLIEETIENPRIERYWVDEILVAVFRSADCSHFFAHFEELLVADQGRFLNRCILLARTSCREYSYKGETEKPILFPVGSVWEHLMYFIAVHSSETTHLRSTILQLLFEWEFKFLFQQHLITDKELVAVIAIVQFYVQELEDEIEYWNTLVYKDEGSVRGLIYLLFGFAPYEKEEVSALLQRADERKGASWQLKRFYKLVIGLALKGQRNQSLIKEHPDLLISLANKEWRYKPEKKKAVQGDVLSALDFQDSPRREDCWGIQNHGFRFSPSGARKTFVLNLLYSDSSKGVAFIVDFINYATDVYRNSEFGNKEGVQEINVYLNKNRTVLKYGNPVLWSSYRGTSNSHDLLECLLMSLEKYLLDLAKREDSNYHERLQEHIAYILKHSHSVATTAVLVSVCMAYPKSVGDTILPILAHREFYEWDLARALGEINAFAPQDNEISTAQKERMASNNMEHRGNHIRGLRGFLVGYQFKFPEHQKYIHKVFDDFYDTYKEDVPWKKAVSEMDIRTFTVAGVDSEAGTVMLEANYPEDIKETVGASAKKMDGYTTSISYSGILLTAIQGKGTVTWEQWETTYQWYTGEGYSYEFNDMPATLARFGLALFLDKINEVQKSWCLETISDMTAKILEYKYTRNQGRMPSFNIIEKDQILESIHLYFQYAMDKKKLEEYRIMIAYVLLCPFYDSEINTFFTYFRSTFSKVHPELAKILWQFLVAYARFEKEHPRGRFGRNSEEAEAYSKAKDEFVLNALQLPVEIAPGKIDFDNHEVHFLGRALLATPLDTGDKVQKDFIVRMIAFVQDDLLKETNYSSLNHRHMGRKLDPRMELDLKFYYPKLLLYHGDDDFCRLVLDSLIDPVFKLDFEFNKTTKDLYKFTQEVLDHMITMLDDIVVAGNEDEIQKYASHFWKLWAHLFTMCKTSEKSYYANQLLLDNNWPIKGEAWAGFIDQKPLFKKIVQKYGTKNFSSILNVYATFGEKHFLPEGILDLVKFLEENPKNRMELMGRKGKTLIEKLYRNHIHTIKTEQQLVRAFLYLLNLMVDQGSSEAYVMRENVIHYKI